MTEGRARVVVSVDVDTEDEFATVVDELRAKGLLVTSQLTEVQVVTGEVDVGRIDVLRRVAGVDHIELERAAGVAPPDSETQ